MKCKNQIVILLSFLLLVSNFGLAFSAQFCCEKIIAVSAFDDVFEECHQQKLLSENCCIIEKEADNCCTSKKIDLKKRTDYLCSIELKKSNIDFVLPTLFSFKNVFTDKSVSFKIPSFSFFYKGSSPPLFKLFCSFIIYG